MHWCMKDKNTQTKKEKNKYEAIDLSFINLHKTHWNTLQSQNLSKTKAVAEMIASRAKVQAQENVRKMAVVTG